MKLKDKNDVNRMIGRRIWCIYPTYESGNPKEYRAEKREYLILGTSKEDSEEILLYDVEEEKIEERLLSDVRGHLNRCGVVTMLYHVNYAWAFTEGRVEKCFQGLLESIEANYRRCEKYKRIKEHRYAFSLSQLEGKGLENLEGEGIEATDKTKYNDPKERTFRLPNNYKEAFTAKALRDLGLLKEIADGKKLFEATGADTVNARLKGKMVFAKDISILIEVKEDLNKKGTLVGKEKDVPARYVGMNVYFKLIGNNYASINKFGKFFGSYRLEKAGGERK